MSGENPYAKIWNSAFIGIFIANTCMSLAQMMTNALVARYADHLGASPSLVGLVTGVFAVTALLFKVVSGPAIDSFNRKIILIGANVIIGLSYFGYGMTESIPMMIFYRLLQGTGMAFSTTCCLALAADCLPKDKFGSGIGYYSMGQAACMAIGPSMALTLVDNFGYSITFNIGAGLMVLAVIASCMIRTPQREKSIFKIAIHSIVSKEAFIPTLIMFFMAMAFCIIGSFLILYAEGLGVENIGLYFTVYAGTMLFTRPFVGRLTDRVGISKVLMPAMFFFALSFLLISVSHSLWLFLIAAFVAAFGYGSCMPAIQTLAMKCVPSEKRGAASNTIFIGVDIAFLSSPIMAGSFVELFGYPVMWRLMIIPIFLALAAIFIFKKQIASTEEAFLKRNAS